MFAHHKLTCFSMAALIAVLPGLPVLAEASAEAASTSTSSTTTATAAATDTFTERYTELTKASLLAGIELERFSLQYRLACIRQPKWRAWRYSAAQEAEAGGLLAFEMIGDRQFALGKGNPARVGQSALHGGLAAFIPTAIVAGAGSGLELASNQLQASANKRRGFDFRSASRYFVGRIKRLDALLAEREQFVSSHTDHPGYERAIVEGKILRLLRQAQITEFANLTADASAIKTAENTFYFLNIVSNSLVTTAAGYAYKSVRAPKYTGAASVIFTIAGAIASVSPLIAQKSGSLRRRHVWSSLCRDLNETPHFDSNLLSLERAKLQELAAKESAPGALIPALPSVGRAALYTESNQLFLSQLTNETKTMQHLQKVALQQDTLAPIIGGSLMTQGILNTAAYYGPTASPRSQLSIDLAGTITGTVGAGVAIVSTPALLLASQIYANKLKKENKSPDQLIKARLEHLDQVEKIVGSF